MFGRRTFGSRTLTCCLFVGVTVAVQFADGQEKNGAKAPPAAGALTIALDPSFGKGGTIVEHSIPSAPKHDRFLALTIDRHGRPVAAGNSTGLRFALARYTADGKPDNSFANSGKASICIEDQATVDAVARNEVQSTFDVTVDAKDRIIIVGKAIGLDANRRADFVLLRFDTSGELDKTFCGVGYQKYQAHDAPNFANAVAAAPDGSYYVAGNATWQLSDPLLIRFQEDGAVDEAFSGAANGALRWLVKENVSATPSGVAIDDQGRCLVSLIIQRDRKTVCGVARLKRDGEVDDTFGQQGLWTGALDEQLGRDGACSVSVDDAGRIVVGCYSLDINSLRRLAVARLTARGNPDPDFGPDATGYIILDGYGAHTTERFGVRAAVFKDRIAVIGSLRAAVGNSRCFGVALIADNGQTIAKLPAKVMPGSNGNDQAWGVAFDSDGRILVNGASQAVNGKWRFAVARYVEK